MGRNVSMKRFRKLLFWVHLVIGLTAGTTITVTVFTGACMAFEKQIIAWAERDLRHVTPPALAAPRLPLDPVIATLRKAQPQAQIASVMVHASPGAAITLSIGRTNTVYVNPYTGEIQPQGAPQLRAFFQRMLRWHRWLGVNPQSPRAGDIPSELGRPRAGAEVNPASRNDSSPAPSTDIRSSSEPTAGPERREGPGGLREIMSTVVGISAAVFCALSISGLYLWWPWSLRLNAIRAVSLPGLRLKGKARDWNWHNALGFWAAPWLILMSLTGMAMAFRPFGNLLYGSGGPSSGPGGASTNAASFTAPEPGMRPLGPDALVAIATNEVPRWETITLRMGGRTGRGRPLPQQAQRREASDTGTERLPSTAMAEGTTNVPSVQATTPEGLPESERREPTGRSGAGGRGGRGTPAISIAVLEPDSWFPRPIQLQVHPFTGEILQRSSFATQSTEFGLRRALRGLNRALHTGEAAGSLGQAIAFLSCAAGLVLVYTGFALSWRRFFKPGTATKTRTSP